MPNRPTYSFIGFLLSLAIYVGLLLFVAFYLQDRVQKNISYTAQKNVVLDITLVEKKPQIKKRVHKKVKKKTIKRKKPKKIAKKPSIKSIKTDAPKKVSLQGLFKKIDTKKIVEPKKKRVLQSRKKVKAPVEPKPEVVRKDDAKKIVDSYDPETLKKDTKKSGVYDKYKGKISQILYGNWQNTIGTVSGNSATVTIFIDKTGTFSYKIEKLSYNDDFNSKLRDFLEEMRDTEFPTFKEGEIFQMQVEFKDIRP